MHITYKNIMKILFDTSNTIKNENSLKKELGSSKCNL